MGIESIVGLIAGFAGCFVGLAGWLAGRDKRIGNDGQWKGETSQNLKDIKEGVSGIGERLSKIEGIMADHETRITVVETKMGIDKEK